MTHKYDLYSKNSTYAIGFHGCDESIAEELLSSSSPSFKMSTNEYDWLGSGMYFWENNPLRAEQFILEAQKRDPKKIKHPTVIGAVLDLGNCLNLVEQHYIDLVKKSYHEFLKVCKKSNLAMPVNKSTNPNDYDYLLRNLDCAVIEFVHITKKLTGDEEAFDSVRGMFVEGSRVYPNAGFFEKTHVQIAIRNNKMIKGYFRPLANS